MAHHHNITHWFLDLHFKASSLGFCPFFVDICSQMCSYLPVIMLYLFIYGCKEQLYTRISLTKTMYQILVIFVLKWAERSSQHRERFTGERFTSVPQISGGEAQKTIVSYSSLCQHTCQSKQPHLTHYIPNSFMVLGSKHAFF